MSQSINPLTKKRKSESLTLSDAIHPKKRRISTLKDLSLTTNILYKKQPFLQHSTKTIKLKHQKFTCDTINYNNQIWIKLANIAKQIYKPYFNYYFTSFFYQYTTQNQLNENEYIIKIYEKSSIYVSDIGFVLFMKFVENDGKYKHLLYKNRFYLREILFDKKFMFDYNKCKIYYICIACGDEDIGDNFSCDVCDCMIPIHLNCKVLGTDLVDNKVILNDKEYCCYFCLNELKCKENVLERRRIQKLKGDEYDVSHIVFHVAKTEEYFIKYDKYPIQAGQHQHYTNLTYQTLLDYSLTTHTQHISKHLNELKPNTIISQQPTTTTNILQPLSISNIKKFIPKKITNYISSSYVTNQQILTPKCLEFKNNYIKKLKKKYNNKIPKIQIPNILSLKKANIKLLNKSILNMLNNNCKINKNIIIGEIIDINNPAMKYHKYGGIHNKPLGIFAINNINKYTILLEYSGIVRTYAMAKKVNDIKLDNQLNETCLFELCGNIKGGDSIFGDCDDDQFVVDPIDYHNEAPYINDYRDDIFSDKSQRKKNAEFIEVIVNGWPRIFCITIENIKKGDEILVDYSEKWWKTFRELLTTNDEIEEIKNNIKNELTKKYEKNIENLKKKYEDEIMELKLKLQQNQNNNNISNIN